MSFLRAKNLFYNQLSRALIINRAHLEIYKNKFNEYPILSDGEIFFWDMARNQYVWHCQFKDLKNIATNPLALEEKKSAMGKVFDIEQGVVINESEKTRKLLLNPFSGQFDWLAEDASGTLYSPDMPDSVLNASPPIRVVNIRCPLTVSDPPYYEDFTKW